MTERERQIAELGRKSDELMDRYAALTPPPNRAQRRAARRGMSWEGRAFDDAITEAHRRITPR